jgi:hypothetical protein
MKTQNEILRWLKNNLGKRAIAPLTSTDVYALVTSVSLSNLVSYSTAPPALFRAYREIVEQMQPHTRYLAYHAIACELDWSHRTMIWTAAGLGEEIPKSKCAFEHGGTMEAAA